MVTETRHTPWCPGRESSFLRTVDRNRRIDSREFEYWRCHECGLIRLANVPADLGAYYPDSYYAIPTPEAMERACSTDLSKLETVRKFVRAGRVLEIGPAYGTFALQALRAGFSVDAIEMDERCCRYLREIGISAVQSGTPAVSMRSLGMYDIVALWHVIEHLLDPWAVHEVAARHCVRGGVIVLAAPNPEAWQFRLMKEAWPHVDAPRHLYLLPRAVLTRFMAGFGFALVQDTTADREARHWNRFGWQRWLINKVSGRILSRAAAAAGRVVCLLASPLETREPNGSAYTLVFRKS